MICAIRTLPNLQCSRIPGKDISHFDLHGHGVTSLEPTDAFGNMSGETTRILKGVSFFAGSKQKLVTRDAR